MAFHQKKAGLSRKADEDFLSQCFFASIVLPQIVLPFNQQLRI